jgi:Ser/Thr protein kinase RdoA (MazF antagonist)
MTLDGPRLLLGAWDALAIGQKLIHTEEISANVSTNRGYRLVREDGHEYVAKTSSYGSYVHFRQDHALINSWIEQLAYTRYRDFLARVLVKDGKVFTHREGDEWVAIYEKAPFYDFLPKRLSDSMVTALGREMAKFHRASAKAARRMPPTWKTLGSDIATLYDFAGSDAWRRARGLAPDMERVLRDHCDLFLSNAESLGYHTMPHLPVLVDWNIGNFSVGFDREDFKLYRRWDYDWFRIEPRALDFYFCARVVRDEGDQSEFSYLTSPLTENRFVDFLQAYHAHYPLLAEEIAFTKEAYRFFILNYVVRSGEHFFRPSFYTRLLSEAKNIYLPQLDALDMRPLVDRVLG